MKKLCSLLVLMLIFSGCGDVEWLPKGTTPDAFSFRSRNSVALSTTVTSETITITGNPVAAEISVSNGEYSIGGEDGEGAFTAAPGKVRSGQTVTVRHISANINEGSISTVLTVGGVSATFTSTTRSNVPQLPVAVTGDPSGTFVLLDSFFGENKEFSDQNNVSVDVMIDLRNTSTTGDFAQVDYVAKDAEGKVLKSGSEQSPFECPPQGISSLVTVMGFDRATFAKIASWQITISVP